MHDYKPFDANSVAAKSAGVASVVARLVKETAALNGLAESDVWPVFLAKIQAKALEAGTAAEPAPQAVEVAAPTPEAAPEPAPAAELVEVRVPDVEWVKRVDAVKPKAKTGYDWSGDFLPVGRLVDLPVGALVVVKYRGKRAAVDLSRVLADGTLEMLADSDGKEWAINLRETASAYLADPAAFVSAVAGD